MTEKTTTAKDSTSATRRAFLGTTAAAAAALAAGLQSGCATGPRVAVGSGILGANDRIRIAVIGCGGRGVGSHMVDIENLKSKCNVEIVSVCDVWKGNLEKAAERVNEKFGRRPQQTMRFMDVLENPEVDAVTIATPDHAHSPILAAAARAGKHAFCEKPMSDRLDTARDALHACEESKIVVQIGTQRRSDPQFLGGAKLIQSGILGTITEVESCWQRSVPSWERDFSDVRQEDVDWEQYLMHLPKRPFDPRRYRCWHLYKDYTAGLPTLLGSHIMDVATWYMEDPVALTCAAIGAKLIWKNREHADTVECVYEFPKGWILTYSNRLGNSKFMGAECNFFGSRGYFDTGTWTANGDGAVQKEANPLLPYPQLREEPIQGEIKADPIPCPGHMQNWLECLRSGKATTAPIRAGYYHTVLGVMAFQSMETGRRLRYFPDSEEIVPG